MLKLKVFFTLTCFSLNLTVAADFLSPTPLDPNIEKDFFLIKNEIITKLAQDRYRPGKMRIDNKEIDREVLQADYLYELEEKKNPYKKPELSQKFRTKKELRTFLEGQVKKHALWIQYTQRFLQNYDLNSYHNHLSFSEQPLSTLFSQFLDYERGEQNRWVGIKKTVTQNYEAYLLPQKRHHHEITGVSALHGKGLNGDGASVIVWDVGFFDHSFLHYKDYQGTPIAAEGDLNNGRDHGTHVSGIIAAKSAARSCRGVAYGAEVLPIDYEGIPDFIQRSENSPAKIVSASFHFLLRKENIGHLVLLEDYLKRTDRLLVLASGNESEYLTEKSFPKFNKYWSHGMWFGTHISKALERHEELTKRILLVGSLQEDGVSISRFSNLPGKFSDHFVFAPGEKIKSTIGGEKLGPMSGTSMATPHVSGILTLISKYNPALSAIDLKNCILSSTDAFWQEDSNKFSHVYDPQIFGRGRVNAVNAMVFAENMSIEKQSENDQMNIA